ncbi:hypothetical protein [Ammoniphilus sp. YIM 78166]|uniref:hypothetical protein n=1 Tax=Ammoniphilus sp. YIM 78166 TaxID=1644106 RepID=UPI00106FC338|nr:hypothetical protein [Ammoniphilus sp. YIM 78166]
MSLYDTLFNWLQLWLVAEARAEDEAAKDSMEHVTQMLKEVFDAEVKEVKRQADQYLVTYRKEGIEATEVFRKETAETLLVFINENPERYDFK